jgi:hypothetical protein
VAAEPGVERVPSAIEQIAVIRFGEGPRRRHC